MPSRGDKKYSGILLALSSLPSRHGIGSLGIEAYEFVDFLSAANQSYWQMLPLVPLGEGNSPYKSVCCFAGEPLYIDLDYLARDGWLNPYETDFNDFPGKVDYAAAREYKMPLIRKAAERFDTGCRDYKNFLRENAFWIDDYALFMAAMKSEGKTALTEFSDGIKYRIPQEMEKLREKEQREIQIYKIEQFFFYKQFYALRDYANRHGIRLIGDIPFYVSPDSSDVWAHPDEFVLERNLTPALRAGVPPDIFSDVGQLWGNPVYDFKHACQNEFSWWKHRFSHQSEMYDVLRIDHFRAFAKYYCIPNGKDAKSGFWETGPGEEFWNQTMSALGSTRIIAEDLGGENDKSVQKLIKFTGFPNMKVLQFGFDSDGENCFLPQNYGFNCVAYTGTHDNNTALGWYEEDATMHERVILRSAIGTTELPVPHAMIKAVCDSKAGLAIIPLQDYLRLGSGARMNKPGTVGDNFVWRFQKEMITNDVISLIRKLTNTRN